MTMSREQVMDSELLHKIAAAVQARGIKDTMARTIRIVDSYGQPRDVAIASLHNFATHSPDPRDVLGRLLAVLAKSCVLSDDQICFIAGAVQAVAAGESGDVADVGAAAAVEPESAETLARMWYARRSFEMATELADATDPLSDKLDEIISRRCVDAYVAGYTKAKGSETP